MAATCMTQAFSGTSLKASVPTAGRVRGLHSQTLLPLNCGGVLGWLAEQCCGWPCPAQIGSSDIVQQVVCKQTEFLQPMIAGHPSGYQGRS